MKPLFVIPLFIIFISLTSFAENHDTYPIIFLKKARHAYKHAGEALIMYAYEPKTIRNLASVSSDSSKWAKKMAKEGYDENELRHKLWSSMLTYMNGEDTARSVTTIHELANFSLEPDVVKDSITDYKNNNYGFKLGKTLYEEGYFTYWGAKAEAQKRILEGSVKKPTSVSPN